MVLLEEFLLENGHFEIDKAKRTVARLQVALEELKRVLTRFKPKVLKEVERRRNRGRKKSITYTPQPGEAPSAAASKSKSITYTPQPKKAPATPPEEAKP